jgi:hypothetical protein
LAHSGSVGIQFFDFQASSWDETVAQIRNLGQNQLLHLKAPSFPSWLSQQGISHFRLPAATRLAADGLIDLMYVVYYDLHSW